MRARRLVLTGAEGNRLVGDLWGDSGPVALLLHGGGQTRHSWQGTAKRLAAAGWRALSVDQRGHGDSERSAEGNYTFPDFAADAAAIGRQIEADCGTRAVAIGASLGGISSLHAIGNADAPLFDALVLVDVTPRLDPEGVERIQGFMAARMAEGFATLEEAAETIASYLPHRPRPRSLEGLRKNLRLDADGRYRWHWDPRFIDGPHPISQNHARVEGELIAAAKALSMPTLLVRGVASELVRPEHAQEFRALVPHAAYADVEGAGHMVAGDRNDLFARAVLQFLDQLATERVA